LLERGGLHNDTYMVVLLEKSVCVRMVLCWFVSTATCYFVFVQKKENGSERTHHDVFIQYRSYLDYWLDWFGLDWIME
jgi:hypothetical protein